MNIRRPPMAVRVRRPSRTEEVTQAIAAGVIGFVVFYVLAVLVLGLAPSTTP